MKGAHIMVLRRYTSEMGGINEYSMVKRTRYSSFHFAGSLVSAPDPTDAAADGLHHRYALSRPQTQRTQLHMWPLRVAAQLRPLGLGPRLALAAIGLRYCLIMSSGALPEISKLMTSWRVWRGGVCRRTSATPIRCCIGRPQGPAAVNLGKDLRMSIRLTSGGDLKSVLDGRAMAGQALLGCLLMSSFQVSSLLGAMG